MALTDYTPFSKVSSVVDTDSINTAISKIEYKLGDSTVSSQIDTKIENMTIDASKITGTIDASKITGTIDASKITGTLSSTVIQNSIANITKAIKGNSLTLGTAVGNLEANTTITSAINNLQNQINNISGGPSGNFVTIDTEQNITASKTLSGKITFQNHKYAPYFYFKPTTDIGGNSGYIFNNLGEDIATNTYNRLYIRLYSRNNDGRVNGYYEDYRLPIVDGNRSSNSSYDILTTKAVIAISQGGTGADNADEARTNIGAAASSHNHSATNITSGTLPVARGGTGADNATEARTKLGAAASNHTHNYLPLSGGTLSGTLGVEKTIDGVVHRAQFSASATSGGTYISHKTNDVEDNYVFIDANSSTFKIPLSVSGGGTGATSKGTTLLNNIGIVYASQAPSGAVDGMIWLQPTGITV